MRHFPIFLDLKGRRVLVAGSGGMAALRARQLLRAGARVHVISGTPQSELASLIATGEVTQAGTELPADDTQSWILAIGADDDPEQNERLHAWACLRGIPVNVVDAPHLCTFIMPAIVDRSPVVIAISTGGASPTLSRLLRERLEALVPAAYGKLALLAESFRDEVKRRLPTMSERRRFWQTALLGPTTDRVLTGNDTEARALLARELASFASEEPAPQGSVGHALGLPVSVERNSPEDALSSV